MCLKKPNQTNRDNFQTDLLDSLIGPFELLPLLVSVNLGVMAMKDYSKFSKVA